VERRLLRPAASDRWRSSSGRWRSSPAGQVVGAWDFPERVGRPGPRGAVRPRPGGLRHDRRRRRIARAAAALRFGVFRISEPAPTTPQPPFVGLGGTGWGKQSGRFGLDQDLDRTYHLGPNSGRLGPSTLSGRGGIAMNDERAHGSRCPGLGPPPVDPPSLSR
jgi:hypothetical protein